MAWLPTSEAIFDVLHTRHRLTTNGNTWKTSVGFEIEDFVEEPFRKNREPKYDERGIRGVCENSRKRMRELYLFDEASASNGNGTSDKYMHIYMRDKPEGGNSGGEGRGTASIMVFVQNAADESGSHKLQTDHWVKGHERIIPG